MTRTEAFAKPAREVAGLAEPAIPGDFGNSKPIESPVAEQALRPVEPAGVQLLAESRARGREQHMNVAARQTESGGDRGRVEVRLMAALAYRRRDTPQERPLVGGRRRIMVCGR